MGSRTDSGFDLNYLGLCRLTDVGWGHGGAGQGVLRGSLGAGFSQPAVRCLAGHGRKEGQFTAATSVFEMKSDSTEGSLHPKFYSE